jgi:methyl-accepting chemotaxis protein
LDDFQREAWDYLNANPAATFSRRETVDGRAVVRVAMADKMVAKGCVTCHNAHPDTPKNDWKLDDVRGVLEVDMAIEPQLAAGRSLANRIALFAALAGLLIAALAAFGARGVAQPVKRMTEAMKQLADGEREIDVPGKDRGDEVGLMAQAVEVFKENAAAVEQLQREQEEQQEKTAEETRQAALALADEFDENVGGVVGAVSAAADHMQSSAKVMTSTADESTQRSSAVAAAAEQASANVQTVATATEELSASLQEVSRQVAECASITQQASTEAGRTNEEITVLAETAEKIGDVIDLINDIASQTNLLALNATIEAARAGEAGKGFAVVASEVKNLASQTAKATEEIAGQIAGIQSATGNFVEAIGKVSGTIEQVNEIAGSIAAAVEQQNAATGEISRSVQEASSATQEVSRNIGTVSEAAAQTGGAAGEVEAAAGDLSHQSETLRDTVDGFLAKVRAA